MADKRRAKGTGTIIKVKDYYYGRIMVKGKVKVVKLSKNQREAESLWKDWLRDNINSFHTDSIKHPLEDTWAMILESMKVKGKSDASISIAHGYHCRVKEWLLAHGIQNVEDITRMNVIDLIDDLGAGKSKRTIREYKDAIRIMFQNACPNIKPRPTDGVKLKGSKQVSRETFSDDEIKLILAKAEKKGIEWKVLIEVGLYTGLRLTDCIHLNTSEIKDGVIELEPRKTKSHGIIVRIPVNEILAKELALLTPDKDGYYFSDLVNMYEKDSNTVNVRLKYIFRAIGSTSKKVGDRTRAVSTKQFHALRYTFISKLADKGVSLPIMESISGHLDYRQTLHYTKPDEAVKKSAIDVLNFSDDSVDDKIFIHPDVKRLMDAFEKQKEEFLAKMEETIGRLVEKGEIDKSSLGHAVIEEIPIPSSTVGNVVKVRLDSELKRRILGQFIALPPKTPFATVEVKKDLLDEIETKMQANIFH